MTAAAVAVKAALMAPDGTNTEAGTVRAARLLDRDTLLPPAGAALESVTVQSVEAEAVRLVLSHCRDVICVGAGATSEMLAVLLAAFRLAVTLAI